MSTPRVPKYPPGETDAALVRQSHRSTAFLVLFFFTNCRLYSAPGFVDRSPTGIPYKAKRPITAESFSKEVSRQPETRECHGAAGLADGLLMPSADGSDPRRSPSTPQTV